MDKYVLCLVVIVTGLQHQQDFYAVVAQLAERPFRKREARCSIHRDSTMCRFSSMVERRFCKADVAGSIPRNRLHALLFQR
jgi:hypothetical protein